jgi:hypothetical protein
MTSATRSFCGSDRPGLSLVIELPLPLSATTSQHRMTECRRAVPGVSSRQLGSVRSRVWNQDGWPSFNRPPEAMFQKENREVVAKVPGIRGATTLPGLARHA